MCTASSRPRAWIWARTWASWPLSEPTSDERQVLAARPHLGERVEDGRMVLVGPELPRIEQVAEARSRAATDELCGPWLRLGRARAKSGVGCFSGRQFSGATPKKRTTCSRPVSPGHDHPRRLGQEAAVVALAMLPLAVPAHLGEPRLHPVLEVEDLADEGKVHVLDIGREPDEVDRSRQRAAARAASARGGAAFPPTRPGCRARLAARASRRPSRAGAHARAAGPSV